MTLQSRNRARDFLRHGLLAVVLTSAIVASATAAQLQLPAMVEPASDEHHTGKVVFVELATPDLAAAKRFYGALLGWTFRDINASGMAYVEAMLDGRSVAGLFHGDVPAGNGGVSFMRLEDERRVAGRAGLRRLVRFFFTTEPQSHRGPCLSAPGGVVEKSLWLCGSVVKNAVHPAVRPIQKPLQPSTPSNDPGVPSGPFAVPARRAH